MKEDIDQLNISKQNKKRLKEMIESKEVKHYGMTNDNELIIEFH